MDADKPGAMEIIELLVTSEIYNESKELTENDLPPRMREHYLDPASGTVARPMVVTVGDIEKIYGVDGVQTIARMLPFVEVEEPGGTVRLDPFDAGGTMVVQPGFV